MMRKSIQIGQMAGKFYNYDASNLIEEEPEYQVPVSSKIFKILKFIVVAAVCIILLIKVGIDNFNNLGKEKL